jgi:hypothetical protein
MRNAIRYEVTVPLGFGGLRLERESQVSRETIPALAVDVIYTTEAGTHCALEKAWALAQDLHAHVRLVLIYSVPYTLPLAEPAVSIPVLQDKLAKLASGFSGEASVHIFLCRDASQALEDVLAPACLVVLGGKKRWWQSKEQRLERRLKKLGRQVIFAESR